MPDSPVQNHQKLKRTILREVYNDNLEHSATESPSAKGHKKAGAKPLLLALALIPALGLLSYFFFHLPGHWSSAPAASLQKVASDNPPLEVAAAPTSASVDHENPKELQAKDNKGPDTVIPQDDPRHEPSIAAVALEGPDPFEEPVLDVGLLTSTAEATPQPLSEDHDQAAAIGENLPDHYQALVDNSDISLAHLFGLSVKTIVIDAGHGGRDPGATGAGGLKEKDVTLDVARRLRKRLEKYPNYRILMTRDKDVKISTRDRVAFANAQKADLFISIHVNSLLKGQLAIIETFYFGAQADEESLLLAEAENQGSEYLMAEFKGMIKKIGDTFKQQESKALATFIQDSLYRNLKKQNDRLANRGTKMAPFIVLLGADMPSVLAEITCISNPGEEKKLATASYRETFAQHLESGIVAYLNQAQTSENLTKGAQQNGQKGTDGKG